MNKDATRTSSDGDGTARDDPDATESGASEPRASVRHETEQHATDRHAAGQSASERHDVARDVPEHRLLRVTLTGNANQRTASLAREVDQALQDLEADSFFQPRGLAGPFDLRLQLDRGRLVFDIRDAAETPLALVGVALGPFRRLVKDYLMLVESHGTALADGRADRVESIDFGRRTLHNEGAELVTARLEGKIALGFETARRLFTLVCVLHQRF